MAASKKCPVCDSASVRVEKPVEYECDRIGLSGVLLTGNGVTVYHCGICGHTTTEIVQEQQLLQVIGLSLLTRGPGLTGDQVRYLRNLVGSTQQAFAEAIGKRRATIAEREAKGCHYVFPKPFDGIGLRVFLMHEFTEHVIESESCLLSARQGKAFIEYAARLVNDREKLLCRRGQAVGITVNRSGRSRSWQAEVCVPM